MFNALAVFTFITFVQLVAGQTPSFIPVGGTCINFAGPVPTPCVPGSICCYVYPDLGLCARVKECPDSFIPSGGLCSGIAGPVGKPCFPGTKCCYVSPDNSQCLPPSECNNHY